MPFRAQATCPSRATPSHARAIYPSRAMPFRAQATCPSRATPFRAQATCPSRATPFHAQATCQSRAMRFLDQETCLSIGQLLRNLPRCRPGRGSPELAHPRPSEHRTRRRPSASPSSFRWHPSKQPRNRCSLAIRRRIRSIWSSQICHRWRQLRVRPHDYPHPSRPRSRGRHLLKRKHPLHRHEPDPLDRRLRLFRRAHPLRRSSQRPSRLPLPSLRPPSNLSDSIKRTRFPKRSPPTYVRPAQKERRRQPRAKTSTLASAWNWKAMPRYRRPAGHPPFRFLPHVWPMKVRPKPQPATKTFPRWRPPPLAPQPPRVREGRWPNGSRFHAGQFLPRAESSWQS